MQPQHLGLLVEAARRGRKGQASFETVDLVWTGPETLGITNRDTAVVVRELFGSAEREVLVAGFAVYQGKEVFKRLAERMSERPNLHVRFFLDVHRQAGDTSLPDEVVRRFLQRFQTYEWPGERLPELRYDPRSLELDGAKRASLHAKCIVVDRKVAFVTSANFTEAAHTRNIEVGALIRSEQFARSLVSHFDALSASRVLESITLCS
jgi:phosphatidylserine/phosphatidylglycerophosphate/cardiolipin synthase-like enzyme